MRIAARVPAEAPPELLQTIYIHRRDARTRLTPAVATQRPLPHSPTRRREALGRDAGKRTRSPMAGVCLDRARRVALEFSRRLPPVEPSRQGRGTEGVRTGASQGAAEIGTPAAVKEPETNVEKKQVELEREQRVAQQQASNPTTEVVGRLFTSARNSVVLCAHAEKQLPLQEVVLYPPFLPALCHRLAMPQIAV